MYFLIYNISVDNIMVVNVNVTLYLNSIMFMCERKNLLYVNAVILLNGDVIVIAVAGFPGFHNKTYPIATQN